MARLLTPAEIQPVVRHFNYIPVAPDYVWGPRVIDDLELILVVRGHFRYEETGRDGKMRMWNGQAGDVFCLEPGRTHIFRQIGAAGVISCLHCELAAGGRWADGSLRLEPPPQPLTAAGADPLLHELFRAGAEAHAGYGRQRVPLVQTLARAIWIRLAEHWAAGGEGERLSPRLAAMLAHIRARLDQPLSRRALAQTFGVTPPHLNALFRRELGLSPVQVIHRERVLRASHLIRYEGWSLKEAAAATGFPDVFYFSRVFRKVTGQPPGSCRPGATPAKTRACISRGRAYARPVPPPPAGGPPPPPAEPHATSPLQHRPGQP